MSENWNSLVEDVLPKITEIRQLIHERPELAFDEKETSSLVARLLEESGVDVRRVRGTGICGLLTVPNAAKTVALRAEMDALPITEETGLAYSSKNAGRSHACGHDGHTAVLLGCAEVLSRIRDQLRCNVKFIFQPAEELGTGAKNLIDDGVLESPHADAIFGLHSWPNLFAGEIGLRYGQMMAGSDRFELVVQGKGGHAAYPHKAIDPIVISAGIITSLQTIVSRERDPIEPIVVTIGRINGGTAYNVIPGSVRMEGTIRTLSATARERTISSILRIANSTANAFGAPPPVLEVEQGTPSLTNNDWLVDYVGKIGRKTIGEQNVKLITEPSMGGEDFAYYLQNIPGAYFRLGVASLNDMGKSPPLHTSQFNFNDESIRAGVTVFTGLVLGFPDLAIPPKGG